MIHLLRTVENKKTWLEIQQVYSFENCIETWQAYIKKSNQIQFTRNWQAYQETKTMTTTVLRNPTEIKKDKNEREIQTGRKELSSESG